MEGTFVLHLQRGVIPPMRKAMHDDCRWDEETMSQLERWTSIGGGNDDGCWSSRYFWYGWYGDGWRCGRYCCYGGAALGKLVCAIGLADGTDVDALGGDTVCVEVRAALGKLVDALDEDTVCLEVGAALGKLVDVLDDTVFVEVGAALGKLVDALDEHRVCLVVGAETRSACINPVH